MKRSAASAPKSAARIEPAPAALVCQMFRIEAEIIRPLDEIKSNVFIF